MRKLIVGCGGGYDIFVGLPLYFKSIRDSSKVCLASFSFTDPQVLQSVDPSGFPYNLYEVRPETPDLGYDFFPELLLAKKLRVSVYCIGYTGMSDLETAYRRLMDLLRPNEVILADGGCDSLCFGYEASMATWVEDSMSLYTANKISRDYNASFFLLLGGVTADFYDGIEEENFLNNLEVVRQKGGVVWIKTLSSLQPNVSKYIDVFEASSKQQSIVNSTIVAAARGIRGKYSPEYLDKRSKSGQRIELTISDLSSKYFLLKLPVVCQCIQYLDLLEGIDDPDTIEEVVDNWRKKNM